MKRMYVKGMIAAVAATLCVSVAHAGSGATPPALFVDSETADITWYADTAPSAVRAETPGTSTAKAPAAAESDRHLFVDEANEAAYW